MVAISVKQNLHTEFDVIVEEFLKGEYFPLSTCQKIINTLFIERNLYYNNLIRKVKLLIGKSKIFVSGQFFIVNTMGEEVSKEEELCLIRYINLCHKTKNFVIILNGTPLYIPEVYIEIYGHKAVEEQLDQILKEIRKMEKKVA